LLAVARNPAAWRDRPTTRLLLQATAEHLADLQNIPQTTYTLYREFQRIGERRGYQAPYNEKRAKMTAAALHTLLGEDRCLDPLQDYIWNVCEETNWVIPAHERVEVDLAAVGTGFTLAEMIIALEGKLAEQIVQRVRAEIERRIFVPYLERHEQMWWHRGHNNWNGVCNGAVGSMFLLLDKDLDRLARALELVLEGLEVFLATAFEAEGSSTEGVGYWQYGLSNVIPFAEMLRKRTNGAIDILASERLRAIAAYPVRMMLSAGHYASFSDSEEETEFSPGLITRLAERTGISDVLAVLAEPAGVGPALGHHGRFHTLWRDMIWWDGTRSKGVEIKDVWLKDVGVVRLAAATPAGVPVVLAAKAGHNAENHNQNDVGSLILHIGGESFLCDPGRGLYSRDYFGPRRYENIFANSFGHNVPRIGGQLQSAGAEFHGEITRYNMGGAEKRAAMTFEKAYAVPELEKAERSLRLSAAGEMVLEDTFLFSETPLPVEEAFVTWLDTTVSGRTARIVGREREVELTIEAPVDATWSLEVLTKDSEANAKPIPLKRLTFNISPPSDRIVAQVRARTLP